MGRTFPKQEIIAREFVKIMVWKKMIDISFYVLTDVNVLNLIWYILFEMAWI